VCVVSPQSDGGSWYVLASDRQSPQPSVIAKFKLAPGFGQQSTWISQHKYNNNISMDTNSSNGSSSVYGESGQIVIS
jgi:hypothetical protein